MSDGALETVVIRTTAKRSVNRVKSARWTKTKERRFLEALATSAHFGRAAASAKTTLRTIQRRRKANPAFEMACDAALEKAAGLLRANLLARSLERPGGTMNQSGDPAAARRQEQPMSDTTRLAVLASQTKRSERLRGGRDIDAPVDVGRLRKEITERLDRLARSLGHEVKR